MSASLKISTATENILGYSHNELLSRDPFDLIHPDDMEAVRSAFIESLLKPDSPVKVEYRFKKANGEYILMETIGINFLSESDKKSIVVSSDKLLNGEQYSARLKESLHEKELILQETHNKVKSTLQLILSLLKLQADHTHSSAIKNCIMMDHNRIKAISFVCQQLYRSTEQKYLNIEEYLYDLATNLLAAHDNYRKNISIRISAYGIHLNSETAVPFGLIVNEMITGSLMRGISDNRPKEIEIKVNNEFENYFTLEYTDKGSLNTTRPDSTYNSPYGLHLINILVKQLHGDIKVLISANKIYRVGFCEINNPAKINV